MSLSKTIRNASAALAGLTAFAVFSAPANAAVFSFADIDNAGTGVLVENQIFVDVTETGGGSTVDFTISNNGPLASIITQINFDDSASNLLGATSGLFASAGVSFVEDLKNLPQGNSISFYSTDGVTREKQGGVNNGITPGEELTIRFNLNATFAAVIAAMTSGDLKLGIHVQALPDGSSDSLITDIPEVPVPAALPLLLSGVAGLAFASRRKTISS